MSKAKTQTRGTCQCCGNNQAVLKTGRISKHGYTVDYGYFYGVCTGQHHLPLEQDRTATDQIIKDVRNDVIALRDKAGRLESGKLTLKTIDIGSHRKPNVVPFADAKEWQQRDAIETAVFSARRRADLGEQFANDLEKRADQVHGTELTTVVLEKPKVEVASKVRVWGKDAVVKSIQFQIAKGVGPALNGHCIEHATVEFEDGRTVDIPKRHVRLAK